MLMIGPGLFGPRETSHALPVQWLRQRSAIERVVPDAALTDRGTNFMRHRRPFVTGPVRKRSLF